MRYLMKENIMILKEDFPVIDESGDKGFYIDNKLFSWGTEINLNENNESLYKIRERILSLAPSYEVLDKNGTEIGRVDYKKKILSENIKINCIYGKFKVRGDLVKHNYEIINNNEIIATVSKKLQYFTDNYCVDTRFEDRAFILCVVIIIDNLTNKYIAPKVQNKKWLH